MFVFQIPGSVSGTLCPSKEDFVMNFVKLTLYYGAEGQKKSLPQGYLILGHINVRRNSIQRPIRKKVYVTHTFSNSRIKF